MLNRMRLPLLLFMAVTFCLKDLASVKFVKSDYVFNMEDADQEKDSEEKDNNDKKNLDEFFQQPNNKPISSTLLYFTFQNSHHSPALKTSFTEIHLPPPERI